MVGDIGDFIITRVANTWLIYIEKTIQSLYTFAWSPTVCPCNLATVAIIFVSFGCSEEPKFIREERQGFCTIYMKTRVGCFFYNPPIIEWWMIEWYISHLFIIHYTGLVWCILSGLYFYLFKGHSDLYLCLHYILNWAK